MRRLTGACAIYTALALLLFGRNIVADPVHRVVGDGSADKTLYMWALDWWPHALRHGHNPLDVRVAWAPHGFDLGLGTAGGGLALVAAPLTAVVGPVATYNVLILLAPALAATTAFLLAHLVTGRFAPSLVGGYLFGFSSYELGRMLGHLPLAFVVLIPLVPYLVLVRRDRRLSRRAFIPLLAAVLVGQFLIVPQIVFSLVVVSGVAAALAAVTLGWSAVRKLAAEAALSLLAALVVVSPLVAYAFVSDAAAPARSAFAGAADVLNYVVPTHRTWLRPPGAEEIAERFTGAGAEQGAYLGLPLLFLVSLAFLRRPLPRGRLFVLALLLTIAALSLGTRVKVAGEAVGIGPWAVVAPLPIVGAALPVRLTMYVSLLAGLLAAIALADRRSMGRWLLAGVAVVATLPNLALAQWAADVPRPALFAGRGDVRHLPASATVLVLPYGPAGWSMLWQAEGGFRFRLVGGHFGLRVTPAEEKWRDVYESLGSGRLSPHRLGAFLAAHDVDAVVVAPGTRARARRAVATAIRTTPQRVGDTLVYTLDPQER